VDSIINKRKIFNDPLYGFISLPDSFIIEIINHRYFQRLRRIKQLGLTHLVYPGALHTRFHHALGAMHLMTKAIQIIRNKGTEITEDEAKGAILAILLHDIGHGPFSHALEYSIVDGITHEELSSIFMHQLNDEFNGQLSTAIEIFKNTYKKKFLHQLVSSQLDMDRLDYLARDSFYSGVSEGVVGTDRIIEMLTVYNDELVIEEKAVYSVEKFIVARRLMYWQVYLHKTVVSAEFMLVNILKRAKKLASEGVDLFCSPALHEFLYRKFSMSQFQQDPLLIDLFSRLDDFDVLGAVKVWSDHSDQTLSKLSSMLINRQLFKVKISKKPYNEEKIMSITKNIMKVYQLDDESASYFVISDRLYNNAYNPQNENINMLLKSGGIKDITQASDNLNISALSQPVEKYFICHPKL